MSWDDPELTDHDEEVEVEPMSEAAVQVMMTLGGVALIALGPLIALVSYSEASNLADQLGGDVNMAAWFAAQGGAAATLGIGMALLLLVSIRERL